MKRAARPLKEIRRLHSKGWSIRALATWFAMGRDEIEVSLVVKKQKPHKEDDSRAYLPDHEAIWLAAAAIRAGWSERERRRRARVRRVEIQQVSGLERR